MAADNRKLAEALFEEAGDALFLFDPDTDQMLAANTMAQRLTGFPQAELLRQLATSLFRMEGKGGSQRIQRAGQQSGIFHSQEGFFLRTRQEGVWIPVNLTITRLHVKPKTLGLITARDIREQREAHNRLQKVEAELRRVLASVSDCLWSAEIDRTGRWVYRYLSPVVEKITGRPPDYFLPDGKRWREVIHAEDRPAWDRVAGQLRAGQASQSEYRLVWPDGSLRWVRDSVHVSRAADGISLRLDGVLTDVTGPKRAEEALRDSEALYHSLVETLPLGVWRKDLEGRHNFANQRFCSTIGKPLAEIVGKTDLDLYPRELAEKYRRDDLKVQESATVFEDVEEYRAANGEQFFIQVVKAPVYDSKGVMLGTEGIFWDVTDRKREEAQRQTAEELARSNQQLHELAADLRGLAAAERRARLEAQHAHEELKKAQSQLVQSEKLSALGQMVAGVAHEINNPLAFVINNVAVLQRDVESLRDLLRLYQDAEAAPAENRADLLQRIHDLTDRIDLGYTLGNLEGLLARSRDGLKRIQEIVKDLRDFARLDESDLTEVDLNAGIESTLNIIRGKAKKHQVEVETDLAPLPLVACYPAKVNQVVLNLVVNAIDASPEGAKVTVRSSAVDDGVEVHVIDSGSGIDPAIHDKIFDPFFTTKPLGQGTGLGLSISYSIAETHGGWLDFESAPGQGTHFIFHLPLRPLAE